MEPSIGEPSLGYVEKLLAPYGVMFIGSRHAPMSPDKNRALLAFATAALLLGASSAPAFAALGGDAATVEQDSKLRHSQHIITPMLQFERHDLTSSAGGSVREYVSRSGKVFAVTWNAQLPPDLRQLFGSYFDSYRNAVVAQSAPGMHRQVFVVRPDLVVQAIGRVRAFQGVAYVPSLVPAGFDLSNLK